MSGGADTAITVLLGVPARYETIGWLRERCGRDPCGT